MLKDLQVGEAHLVADLAKAARTQRDSLLGNVPDTDFDVPSPERGERDPSGEIGFDVVPAIVSRQATALREAVASLSEPARRELYTLMRIGQGHLAAKNWGRGLSDAEVLGDDAITGELVEDPNLQEHLIKGLHETRLGG